MARHLPSLPRRRRAVSAALAGAAALGAVALVPGLASAAPVPTTPTAPTTTPARADLSVTIAPTTTIPANDESALQVTITNNGPTAADRVRTQVQLPPGIVSDFEDGPSNEGSYDLRNVRFDEPGPLASGASRTYTLFVSTTRARATTGTVSAQVRSTTPDNALRNNRATAPLRAEGGPYFD